MMTEKHVVTSGVLCHGSKALTQVRVSGDCTQLRQTPIGWCFACTEDSSSYLFYGSSDFPSLAEVSGTPLAFSACGCFCKKYLGSVYFPYWTETSLRARLSPCQLLTPTLILCVADDFQYIYVSINRIRETPEANILLPLYFFKEKKTTAWLLDTTWIAILIFFHVIFHFKQHL